MLIEVIPLINSNEYSTLSSSVEASLKKTENNNIKVNLVNGHNLISYGYKGDELYLFFSNGKYLVVSIGNNTINWNIINGKPFENDDLIKSNLVLKLPDGDEYDWGCKILNQMLNKKIIISPSDQNLFIFTDEERIEYMFDAYCDRTNKNNRFIFLFES